MPRYKRGKQTEPIDFNTFDKAMKGNSFRKPKHRSLLAFLYWFGVRRSEALERVKEDFKEEDEFLVVKVPKKTRIRELKLPLKLPYVNLILNRVKKIKKGDKVWDISPSTVWRIVKRALGEKYYPHFLRVNRAKFFLGDPRSLPKDVKEWFGLESLRDVDRYIEGDKGNIDRLSSILGHGIEKSEEYMQLKRSERASGIVIAIGVTNLLFEVKKGAKLFRGEIPRLISDFYISPKNEDEFTSRITRLASIFRVPLTHLRRLIHEYDQKWGSIRLVEKWLLDEGIKYDADMIETWKKIVVIRNWEPIHAHKDPKDYLEALNFFGTLYPVKDYSKLWDVILEKFAMSLEAWQRILENL